MVEDVPSTTTVSLDYDVVGLMIEYLARAVVMEKLILGPTSTLRGWNTII